MFKNVAHFSMLIGEKLHQYICDNDSPIEHVEQFACELIKFAGQIKDQAKAQQEASKIEEPKIEELKVE